MSYNKTNWQTGDTITSAGLNNIENGVYNNDDALGNKIDNVVDVTNEFTINTNNVNNFKAYKIGGMIWCYIQGTNLNTQASNDELITIPTKYTPAATIYAPFTVNGLRYGSIAANPGTNKIIINQISTAVTSNGRLYANFVYPIS